MTHYIFIIFKTKSIITLLYYLHLLNYPRTYIYLILTAQMPFSIDTSYLIEMFNILMLISVA